MSDDNFIKLYPSHWLYNASVIGLLRVMSSTISEQSIDTIFTDSAEVIIPKEWFEEINVKDGKILKATMAYSDYLWNETPEDKRKQWLDDNKDKYNNFFEALGLDGLKFVWLGNKLFASNTPYQNMMQLKNWQAFEFQNLLLKDGFKHSDNSIICGLCQNFRTKKINPDSKFEKTLATFQLSHNSDLGPSIGEFPNSFWNNKDSLIICPFCAYLLLHSNIAMSPTMEGQVFINAPSFRLMWYLNKYTKSVFSRMSTRDVLAMSLIDFSQKVNATLGMWSIANIEVVLKKRGSSIEHFSIPYVQTRLLLNRKITALITKTREPYVLDAVLSGRFVDLLIMNEKLLKAVQSNNMDEGKRYLRNYENHRMSRMRTIAAILPELYIQINKQLHEEVI